MIRVLFFSILMLTTAAASTSIPKSFDSSGEDRLAIETLLGHYTQSVSTKNQALFETLLLNKNIPFAGISTVSAKMAADGGTQQYAGFRDAVFAGPPFEQRFQNVHIQQDGFLANVSLVFVNTTAQGSSWGWKTLQLLKVDGHWKIASEFYTGHP